GGREPPVGPLFGEAPRLGEHPRHTGMLDLEGGDDVQEPAGPDSIGGLQDVAQSALDDKCGMTDLAELGQRKSELAADRGGREVGHGLALDDRGELVVTDEGVIANRELPSLGRYLASGEPPRIAFAYVHGDRDRLAERAGERHADPGPRTAHRGLG